jgi:hypothetical protein
MAPTKVECEFAQAVALVFEKVLTAKGDATCSVDWMNRSRGERAGWLKVVKYVREAGAKKPAAKKTVTVKAAVKASAKAKKDAK